MSKAAGGLVSEKPTGAIGGRVEPGVPCSVRAPLEDGILLSRVEGGQHPRYDGPDATPRSEDECAKVGCCSFDSSRSFDLHLDELNYSSKGGDNSLSSAAESDGGWIELEVTVDSGACDTVMPISSCNFKILPSYQSKNLGERKCLIRTPGSREERRITFQVANVHKPLLSVTCAADACSTASLPTPVGISFQGMDGMLGRIGYR